MHGQSLSQKGFTLVEIMIVVAILGVLAAVAIPQFLRFTWKSKRTEAIVTMAAIRDSQLSYFSAKDHYAVDPDPAIVNEDLGLGPIHVTPKSGYEFFYGSSNSPAFTPHGTFTAILLANIDDNADPLDFDTLCIHDHDPSLCGTLTPLPNLTWGLVYDDITNQWF